MPQGYPFTAAMRVLCERNGFLIDDRVLRSREATVPFSRLICAAGCPDAQVSGRGGIRVHGVGDRG